MTHRDWMRTGGPDMTPHEERDMTDMTDTGGTDMTSPTDAEERV